MTASTESADHPDHCSHYRVYLGLVPSTKNIYPEHGEYLDTFKSLKTCSEITGSHTFPSVGCGGCLLPLLLSLRLSSHGAGCLMLQISILYTLCNLTKNVKFFFEEVQGSSSGVPYLCRQWPVQTWAPDIYVIFPGIFFNISVLP